MSTPAARVTKKAVSRTSESAARDCTVILPKCEIRLPLSVFTFEGFRAWAKSDDAPEHTRVTFVNQKVIIDMSGEELRTHMILRTAVCGELYKVVVSDDLGVLSMGGALVSNEPAKVSNIPDAALATWASLEAGRVRPVASDKDPNQYLELEGTPDWVLEIVSDSSVQKDKTWLREAYHHAGILEYWLIDARGEELAFQILLNRTTRYEPAPKRGGWQRSQVFKRRFRLERRQGRMGWWQYTLHMKPRR